MARLSEHWSGKGWHHEDIKAAIRKTGITLKALSLKHGLSESATRVALRLNSCPSGERAIAEHLGINPHELWPDRYHPDGTRSIGQKNSAASRRRHRLKGEAA